MAKQALVTWIRYKQKKGRSTELILAKLRDIESRARAYPLVVSETAANCPQVHQGYLFAQRFPRRQSSDLPSQVTRNPTPSFTLQKSRAPGDRLCTSYHAIYASRCRS